MAASSEIRFRIAGDTSALSRGFAQATSVAAAASKAISKQFDLRNVFNRTVLSLGVSIESLAAKVSNVFNGGSLEGFNTALTAAQETAKILEAAYFERLGITQQIAAIEARIQQNRSAESPDPREAGTLTGWRKAFDSKSGRAIMASLGFSGFGETAADAITRSQNAIAQKQADEARKIALEDKKRRNDERVAQARRDLQNLGLDGQDKFNAQLAEATIAGDRLIEARRKSADTTEMELEFINKMKAAKLTLLEIDRAVTTEQENRARAQESHRNDIIRHYAEYLKAEEDLKSIRAESNRNVQTLTEQSALHKQALLRGEIGAGPENVFDPRHKFRPDENAVPPSPWDMRFGRALKNRSDSMSQALDARNSDITSGIRARNVGLMGMPGAAGDQVGLATETKESAALNEAAQKLLMAADKLAAAMAPVDVLY